MTDLRPTRLFQTLTDGGVTYLVVGGIAAIAHGVPRGTHDVDIVVERDIENLKRLAALMDTLGVPDRVTDLRGLKKLNPRDEFDLARGLLIRLETTYGRLDLIADPAGSPPFADMAADAEIVRVDDVPIPIVSRAHLLKMKTAAGRPKDLADISDLTRDV